MSSINKVMLLGRLGKDPESRNVNGRTVANFSLATSEKYTDKTTGEKKEITEWSNIVAWGPTADVVVKYVKKGHLLYVEGKLRTRTWDDQSGVRKYITEIVAHEVQLMPNDKPAQAQQTYTPPAQTPANEPFYTERSTDDLPF